MTARRGLELAERLARLPPAERDRAAEVWLGIAEPPPTEAPGAELVPYQPSGVSPIVRALREAVVTSDDVLVDLGSGLGKVVFLAALFTGAKARGIEREPALVRGAERAARELGLDVGFSCEDVRDASLDDGTVFFLYTPCTGSALRRLLDRLHGVARRRAIVVCALGSDLPRDATWLVPRPTDAFWLTLYDGVLPGAAPRVTGPSRLCGAVFDALAGEHALAG
ncbi:MAG TPA: methyltransferase domain-containing protein [Polyangiaceae bacterium]|nr:methyltransferase domain-containing protein [Polyangiaceae bacterium]